MPSVCRDKLFKRHDAVCEFEDTDIANFVYAVGSAWSLVVNVVGTIVRQHDPIICFTPGISQTVLAAHAAPDRIVTSAADKSVVAVIA